jgi:NAD-dependent DNA ligase
MRKGEPFRARAYKKAEETILLQTSDITDYKDLEGLTNIGPTILSKLKELQETKTLRVLERERQDPLQLFTQIHGIGPKKAQTLIDNNVKSIEELQQKTEMLNDNQKLGLRYFKYISERIPRAIIDKYQEKINHIHKELNDPNLSYDIVGSYRRGATSSGDIDIIVTHKENKREAYELFLNELKTREVIVEFLSKGKVKSLTITKIDDDIPRRVDFLYAPPEEYAFAKLYFTGSKGFNTMMRHRALQFGYSLNEHGISKLNSSKEKMKIDFMEFPDEKSIFDFLKMEYKEPTERIDGRAVVSTTGTPIMNATIKTAKTKKVKKTTVVKPNMKTTKKSPKSRQTSFIKQFRKEGVTVLDTKSENDLIQVLKDASDAFFNDVSIITDNEYDIIKEYVKQKYPDNKEVDEVGAPVIERNKVTLPYYMGSMDKIKPDTNALAKWQVKYTGPYILSAKLDGVSGMYSTMNGTSKLYTRGNGTIGQDISYFVPHLRLPKVDNLVIRGEFIINRHTFVDKYSSQFSNARNFVSGIINAKSIDSDKFADIDFVAYEIIEPSLKPSEQMKMLDELNVANVLYETHNEINNDKLSDILVQWRTNYQYESDGVICTNDDRYPRMKKNPEYSFAFKMVLSEQIAEAKVLDVIWNVSKDGLLKPKIQIEPIVLGGATIQFATAHNAATVVANKLGIGAIVKIIRSGDVIPYIMDTVVPAETLKMPTQEYKWNETNVDIELVDKTDNLEILQKTITGFFTGISVDGLSSGNVSRIIKSGYKSIPQIVKMSKEDLLKVEGFKEKMANKIHDSIQLKLKESELSKLIASSNVFGGGFGEKKIHLILNEYPDVICSKDPSDIKLSNLTKVKGMALKTAQKFIEKIPAIIRFLDEIGLKYRLKDTPTIQTPEYDTTHALYNKSIVFTGVRDKQLMEKLVSKYSVNLSSSVSKNTFAVISKSKLDESSKLSKARSLNISIYEIDEFKSAHGL